MKLTEIIFFLFLISSAVEAQTEIDTIRYHKDKNGRLIKAWFYEVVDDSIYTIPFTKSYRYNKNTCVSETTFYPLNDSLVINDGSGNNCFRFIKIGRKKFLENQFYASGALREEGLLFRNKKEGDRLYYYHNGAVWANYSYKSNRLKDVKYTYAPDGTNLDKGTISNGNGTLHIYNEAGELCKKEFYKKGKLKEVHELTECFKSPEYDCCNCR